MSDFSICVYWKEKYCKGVCNYSISLYWFLSSVSEKKQERRLYVHKKINALILLWKLPYIGFPWVPVILPTFPGTNTANYGLKMIFLGFNNFGFMLNLSFFQSNLSIRVSNICTHQVIPGFIIKDILALKGSSHLE